MITILIFCTAILFACAYNNSPTTGSNGNKGNNTTVAVQSISLSLKSVEITKSEYSKTLTASIYPSNATNKTIKWSSSNTKIAQVDTSGKVTFKSEGDAVITATTSNGKTATCNVRCIVPYFDKIVSFFDYHGHCDNFINNMKKFMVDDKLSFSIYSEEKSFDYADNQYTYRLMISNKNNGNSTYPLLPSAIYLYPTIGKSVSILDDLLSANSSNYIELQFLVGSKFITCRIFDLKYKIVNNKLNIEDCSYYTSDLTNNGYSLSLANNAVSQSLGLIEDAVNEIRNMFLSKNNMDIFYK